MSHSSKNQKRAPTPSAPAPKDARSGTSSVVSDLIDQNRGRNPFLDKVRDGSLATSVPREDIPGFGDLAIWSSRSDRSSRTSSPRESSRASSKASQHSDAGQSPHGAVNAGSGAYEGFAQDPGYPVIVSSQPALATVGERSERHGTVSLEAHPSQSGSTELSDPLYNATLFKSLPVADQIEAVARMGVKRIRGLGKIPLLRDFVREHLDKAIQLKLDREYARLRQRYDFRNGSFSKCLGEWTWDKGLWRGRHVNEPSINVFVQYFVTTHSAELWEDDKNSTQVRNLRWLAHLLVELHILLRTAVSDGAADTRTGQPYERIRDIKKSIAGLSDFPEYVNIANTKELVDTVHTKPSWLGYVEDNRLRRPAGKLLLTQLIIPGVTVVPVDVPDVSPQHWGNWEGQLQAMLGLPQLPVGFAYCVRRRTQVPELRHAVLGVDAYNRAMIPAYQPLQEPLHKITMLQWIHVT